MKKIKDIECFQMKLLFNRINIIIRFFRRPDWSPDGSFFLIPCGKIY